jgi:hypothetical protein
MIGTTPTDGYTPSPTLEQEERAEKQLTPIEHWAYHVVTPFRPVHELLEMAPAAHAPRDTTQAQIPWSGSADQVAFRELVLQAQLDRSRSRKGPPSRDLSRNELAPVAGTNVQMRRDAAEAASRLIAAANEALAAAKQTGDPDALKTRRVTAASGYRGSEHQAQLWRGYFADYYRRTAGHRQALPSGPHGPEAVSYMIKEFGLPKWIAAPGYSNHQSGVAIDLQQERVHGAPIRNSSRPAARTAWRGTWLYGWLVQNAASFGFRPYEREPWHWEYRPAAPTQETIVAEEYEPTQEAEALGLDEEVQHEEAVQAPVYELSALEEDGLLEALDEDEEAEGDMLLDVPETDGGGLGDLSGLGEMQPLLEEAEGLFDRAREVYRDAIDAVKTRVRIGQGILDENQLTDRVFADRYPDRPGPLRRDDPDFAERTHIWSGIRDRIVRPALRARSRPGYDRTGALAYARKYWLRPCDDQFIALSSNGNFAKVPPGTKFEHEFGSDGKSRGREHALLPNGSRIPFERLDDCTHFISCCIGERPGEQCGGLKITYTQFGSPPKAPYGIVRAATMVDFLTGRLKGHPTYAETVAEKSEDDSIVSQLQPGDLVAYFNVGRQRYTHLAMLLEGGRIACHSYGRSDQPQCTWPNNWDIGRSNHQWTFLRFIV